MKRFVGFLFFALAAFAFGFSANDLAAGQKPSMGAVKALFGAQQDPSPAQLYQAHFDQILNKYQRNLDPKDLHAAAMEGLVATLGDPHTDYFEPVAADRFNTENEGNFVGVGARLGEHALGAQVAMVFENGPAEKAGLKVNDTIVTVDGMKMAGKSLTEIVSHIRGEAGTNVVLGVIRASDSKQVDITITRASVEIPSAEGKILAGNIGYITVSQFTEVTPKQFASAMQKVMDAKVVGLIIDLREDPGGLLQSASSMLGKFVSNKTVVTMKMRYGVQKSETTPTGETVDYPKPVVILIDENSASAAEIFSGVLRDYKIATLVGEHSYGKTSVQNIHTIPSDNASVKVTIAKYFLPSGVNFDRKVDEDGTYLKGGLVPDYDVELPTGEQVVLGDPTKDPQLKKAIDVVMAKQGK